MIGNAIFKEALKLKKYEVLGTYRNLKKKKNIFNTNLVYFNAYKKSRLKSIIRKYKPDLLINAIGITKHIKNKKKNIYLINSTFPHYAKKIANNNNCKFIQISTDCIFDGNKGNYKELDKPNAIDDYGISKARGEIVDKINLTVRTSTIGHEIETKNGLLEWFLSQKGFVMDTKKQYLMDFQHSILPKFYFLFYQTKRNLLNTYISI